MNALEHIGDCKYVIFIDVDGTITSIPGGKTHPFSHSVCLFRWAELNRDQTPCWPSFFMDKNGQPCFEAVKAFLGALSDNADVAIIPVTNNYKLTAQQLMQALDIKVGPGFYRETNDFSNKAHFINFIVRRLRNRQQRFIFYLDDNLDDGVSDAVIKINCNRGQWLGELLKHHVGRPIDFFNYRT